MVFDVSHKNESFMIINLFDAEISISQATTKKSNPAAELLNLIISNGPKLRAIEQVLSRLKIKDTSLIEHFSMYIVYITFNDDHR